MRILIIGASSFFGGHLRRAARAEGHTVLTSGRSRSGGWDLWLDLAAETADQVAALIASVAPDVVINCAGATSGSAQTLAAANITAVHTLVTALLTWPAGQPPRLVHIGSAAEYGAVPVGVPVAEDAVPRPAGLYGVTKLGGTRLVELARTAGADAVVLRLFNVVGAGASRDTLPGAAAAQLRHGGNGASIKLGSLEAVRDFVDARDAAGAALAAATAPALPHAVVNIGSGRGVQARVLVRELIAVTGLDVDVHEDAAGSARSAGLGWQQAGIARAAADLGWRPARTLADSVRDLWEGVT
jgi:nucleoside-diphosphate-sugar epimerase